MKIKMQVMRFCLYNYKIKLLPYFSINIFLRILLEFLVNDFLLQHSFFEFSITKDLFSTAVTFLMLWFRGI